MNALSIRSRQLALDLRRLPADSGQPRRGELAAAWEALIHGLDLVLRELRPESDAAARLRLLRQRGAALSDADAQASLRQLVQLAGQRSIRYTAHHAWLCWALVRAAQPGEADPSLPEPALEHAALSMHCMLRPLQDRLALQPGPPTAAEQALIQQHAVLAGSRLAALPGVDGDWLRLVREHHGGGEPATRLLALGERLAAAFSRRIERPAMDGPRLRALLAQLAADEQALLERHPAAGPAWVPRLQQILLPLLAPPTPAA
ncbi:MAG: hypothetical protein KBC73_14420 [Burkholderiaceae bacterium]|nr:hypothetical protein [Burkholderiaceae bacterium]